MAVVLNSIKFNTSIKYAVMFKIYAALTKNVK
jgi:hypothetical protein